MFLNIIVTFYSFVSYVVLCIENRPCVELNLFCKFSTSAGRSGSTSMLQVILSFIENMIRNQRMTEKVTPLINILYRRNPLPFKNAQCVCLLMLLAPWYKERNRADSFCHLLQKKLMEELGCATSGDDGITWMSCLRMHIKSVVESKKTNFLVSGFVTACADL